MRSSFIAFSLLGTLAATAAQAADEPPAFNPPRAYYLSLGDSHAYGFQAHKTGLPPSGFDTGYVDVFAARLRAIRPDVQVVNYGCPGESTVTFLGGSCPWIEAGGELHDPFEGPQLDAALRFLRSHPGQVGPITISLHGNDVGDLIRACEGELECVEQNTPTKIAEITANLSTILGRLRDAAPNVEIIVLGPYNPFVGHFDVTDPLYGALDEAMSVVAAQSRVRFADVFGTFNPQGDVEAETEAICTLTLVCSRGDIHASDLGYEVIADLVWRASGYERLLD